MILSNLKLINFRNYDNLDLTFSKGLNFIVGENASGKTNLVESIFYLSLARSFKTHNDLEAIKVNSSEALIKGRIYSNDIFNNLSIKITSKGKIIYLNDKKINKLSELTKYLNVLLFVPSDTNLMKNSPKERRFFLNLNLSKMSLSYQNALINYEKLLKERNNELKKEKVDLILLDVLTTKLIEESQKIYLFRKKFINEINSIISNIYQEISFEKKELEIRYLPFVNVNNFTTEATEKYQEALNEDLSKKVTTIGVHKEDFEILINKQNIAKFGSQGENRLAVLSLKLAPYFLISKDELKPLVILDDILSELDENHETLLINFLKQFNQVFITSAKRNKNMVKNVYKVENNTIKLED